MLRFGCSFALLASLCVVPSINAKPSVLEVIPDNVEAAIFLRNAHEMSGRKDAPMAQQIGQLIVIFGEYILHPDRDGPKPALGVDFSRPFGFLLCVSAKKEDECVLRFEVKDTATLAKVYPVAEKFAPKKMLTLRGETKLPIGHAYKYLYVEGKSVLLSPTKEAIEKVLAGKPLARKLAPVERKHFESEDLICYAGVEVWGQVRLDMVKAFEESLKPEGKRETQVAKQLVEVLTHLRYAFVSASLRNGLHVSAQPVFGDDKQQTVRKFMDNLRGNDSTSHLSALPEGNLLFAQAASGDGSKTVTVSKLLFEFFLRERWVLNGFVAAPDRPNVVTVYSELWRRLRGQRLAVYLNEHPAELGMVSTVAILDVEDTRKFLTDIRQLAKLGDPTSLQLKDKGKDIPLIEKLIAQLGDDDFETRESASARLRLVGPHALPFLRKALDSDDAEIVRRAKRLTDQIVEANTVREADLLSGKFPYRLRPSFTYYPRAEKRQGVPIDVVKAKIAGDSPNTIARLKGILGPEWNTVRLAPVRDKVVVLIGSDIGLMDKALENLEGNKPGLSGEKQLLASTKHVNETRHFEMHLTLQQAFNLYAQTAPNVTPIPHPSKNITSFSMQIEADRLRWDLWIPEHDLQYFRRLFNR